MSRLTATMWCDVRLQARNGFYWAVAFLVAAWAILITQIPAFDWAPLLAPLVLGNLVMATFMFMAGLVLLEKNDGTLEAQIVTPLRTREYLASKVVTLTVLSVVENALIVLLATGRGFRLPALVLGIAAASAIYCLLGFVAVARYDSINEFLFPSMIYVTALSLPYLDYAGLWRTPLMLFHPLQPALVLLTGAFYSLDPLDWLYGVFGSVIWIALAMEWCRRSFRRFVVARAGARPR